MRRTLLALPFLALPAFAPGAAALPEHTPIRPESRVWITGASNLRRFSCRARDVEGSLALQANATRSAVLSGENGNHVCADLVRDVAVCGNAVRAHNDCLHTTFLHYMAAHVIRNERDRYLILH